MKATMVSMTLEAPSPVHIKHAARALKCKPHEIPEFPHVRALACWIDGVLWCGGDQHARNAILDRMCAKEARVIVQDERTARKDLAAAANVPVDEARRYMDGLSGEPEAVAAADPDFDSESDPLFQ